MHRRFAAVLISNINEKKSLSIHPDIDVNRDWKTILATGALNKRERSLLVIYPEIAATWNYEKNEGLKPESFLPGSNKKVWWKCPECGFEWEEIIVNRTKKQLPCSKCGGGITRRLIPGVNDLASKHPEIAAEWNYKKNGDAKPEDFTYGSSVKVWWICSTCTHEWESTIANRSTGYGCPICGKKKAIKSLTDNLLRKGENDLLTINPFAASQWDYEKNSGLTPYNTLAHSNQSVWWKCKVCGGSWKAIIASRAKSKDCPFCTNRRLKLGLNDIFSAAPYLKEEWDYEKNSELDPAKTICSSTKKVGWLCSRCGHKWEATIRNRWKGQGCPVCAVQKRVSKRTENKHNSGNTLAKAFPSIAVEWHPSKNGTLTPEMVTSRNGEKVWWLCSKCGYEFLHRPGC